MPNNMNMNQINLGEPRDVSATFLWRWLARFTILVWCACSNGTSGPSWSRDLRATHASLPGIRSGIVDDVDGPRFARIEVAEPIEAHPDRARATLLVMSPSLQLAAAMGSSDVAQGSASLDGVVRASGDLVTFDSQEAPVRLSWTFTGGALLRRGETSAPYFASRFGGSTSVAVLLLDQHGNVIASHTWRSDD